MKIKLLGTLGLASLLFVSACGGGSNTNANNSNTNANKANAATPVAMTNEAAKTDPNLKPKIEEALKAKGFKDVTVDTSGAKVAIRGTVPKGKLGEVVQIAQEANGGKPVDNQVTEK